MPALVVVAVASGCSGGEPEREGVEAVDEATTESTATMRQSMTSAELVARLDDPEAPLILDVRSPKEYDEGHIPGAINIPYDQVADRSGELQEYRERGLVVYCRTGRRAGIAEQALADAGFEQVWDLEGHMVVWQEGEYPLVVPAVN
jgi:rhodanese-related sulfurtransferase